MTAVLEKNRDNIAKALPGLAKFEITVGEGISSMYAYSAFVPNFLAPQIFQPFFDYLWGFRTFDTSRGPGYPSPVPRSLVPFPYNAIPPCPGCTLGGQNRRVAMISRMPRSRLAAVAAVVLVGLIVAGAAVLVRNTFFGPRTITAYFTSATAIYPR